MPSITPATYIELTACPIGDNTIEGNYLTVESGKVELYFQIYDEHGNYVSLVLREVDANHLALLADVVNGAQCKLLKQEQEEQEAQPPK